MIEKITYNFCFQNGHQESIHIEFNLNSLRLKPIQNLQPPEWTVLEFQKCLNCSLNDRDHPRCPVALHLVEISERFGETPSHEPVTLNVHSSNRVISANTTAQRALGSLMGLIMPLSGCPILAPLAPMARFHLPLSSEEETIYRVTSMYVLSTYFNSGGTLQFSDDFSGLQDIYSAIQLVNQGLSARLRLSGAFEEVNSIAILDLYAQALPIVIEEALSDIQYLFLKDADSSVNVNA